MRPTALIPRAMVMRKPPHGAPCTHCGVCCTMVLCPLAKKLHGNRPGPCPELRFNAEQRSSCGLMLRGTPQQRAAISLLIGSGDGCDARINREPINYQFNKKLQRLDNIRREERQAAGAIFEKEILNAKRTGLIGMESF